MAQANIHYFTPPADLYKLLSSRKACESLRSSNSGLEMHSLSFLIRLSTVVSYTLTLIYEILFHSTAFSPLFKYFRKYSKTHLYSGIHTLVSLTKQPSLQQTVHLKNKLLLTIIIVKYSFISR